MLVRCALYFGTVKSQSRKRFDGYVREVHLPMVADWPRLRDLKLLKNEGAAFLGEEPKFYHTFELYFDNQEDMDVCMASEERQECRRVSKEDFDTFKGLFDGEVHHVNFAITDIPLRPNKRTDD